MKKEKNHSEVVVTREKKTEMEETEEATRLTLGSPAYTATTLIRAGGTMFQLSMEPNCKGAEAVLGFLTSLYIRIILTGIKNVCVLQKYIC